MAFKKAADEVVTIKQPNIQRVTFRIVGTAPLVIHAFGKKAREKRMADMATPKAAKKARTEREPRNYEQDFNEARHVSYEGWDGIPASAFRHAMIDACRLCGLVMTRAKLTVFVVHDGVDRADGTTTIVKIIAGEPERSSLPVRNDDGSMDIRVRPMWREWAADVTVEFDADMITAESVANLLMRAGRQVGICEGRPYSSNSTGMGWGTFKLAESAAEVADAA